MRLDVVATALTPSCWTHVVCHWCLFYSASVGFIHFLVNSLIVLGLLFNPAGDDCECTCLSWNASVAHIIATGTGTGQTVVWDLKQRKHAIR